MMLVLVYLQVSAGLWLVYFACTISSFHAWSDHSKLILFCPRNKTKKFCRVKQINPQISVDKHPKSVYVPASSYKVFLLYDKIFDTIPLSVPFSLSFFNSKFFDFSPVLSKCLYVGHLGSAVVSCKPSSFLLTTPRRFLCFSSCLFVRRWFRTFVRFALVLFCLFPVPLGVWKRLRSVIVALPGLFFYPCFHYCFRNIFNFAF